MDTATALQAVSTVTAGAALGCEFVTLGVCSPVAALAGTVSLASGLAATTIDGALPITGHESGVQLGLDIMGDVPGIGDAGIGVSDTLKGIAAVRIFVESNALALGLPSSAYGLWNLASSLFQGNATTSAQWAAAFAGGAATC
jgi:hypothetical protein